MPMRRGLAVSWRAETIEPGIGRGWSDVCVGRPGEAKRAVGRREHGLGPDWLGRWRAARSAWALHHALRGSELLMHCLAVHGVALDALRVAPGVDALGHGRHRGRLDLAPVKAGCAATCATDKSRRRTTHMGQGWQPGPWRHRPLGFHSGRALADLAGSETAPRVVGAGNEVDPADVARGTCIILRQLSSFPCASTACEACGQLAHKAVHRRRAQVGGWRGAVRCRCDTRIRC